MKLATLRTGRDGRLVVVSRDLSHAAHAKAAPTLQAALDDWANVAPQLEAEYAAVNAGDGEFAMDTAALDAILPRGYQFLDASAFLAHNHILADAWGFAKRGEAEPPLMYQGISHRYYAPGDQVDFADTNVEIDFEAELGVITDDVPMGILPEQATEHARLVILINDWSLRAFGPSEMRGGFGFLHAKPPSTLSSFAMTPDELGDAWRDGRVCLPLHVRRGDELFGRPNGAAMHFGFGELIAHAAATRDLYPGTVIGSGTVSNFDAETVGSACIAERRALDTIAGRTPTAYLQFGERVSIELFDQSGQSMLGKVPTLIGQRTR